MNLDQRKKDRFATHCRAWLRAGEGPFSRVCTADLSSSGCCLVSPQPQLPHQLLDLQLKLDGGAPLCFRARVIWCSACGPDAYRLGLELCGGQNLRDWMLLRRWNHKRQLAA